MEKRCCGQTVSLLRQVAEKDLTFSETMSLSLGREGAAELLHCRANGIVTETKAIGNKLIFKGVFLVSALYHTIGGQLASARAELLERGYDKLKTYGAGRDLSYKEWKEYIYQMIQLGYMEIDYAAERVLRMTPLGRRVLYGEQKAQLVIYREPDELTRPVRRGERKSSFKAQPIRPIRSASTDETLLDSLRQLRKQIAEREHTPAYIIFSDDSLEDMVEKKPVTLDQFSDIRGVGQIKLDRYGKVFVALIRFVLKLPK